MDLKRNIKELVSLANALMQFKGYQQIVEENGKKKAILVPYALLPKGRWNISKDISILKRIGEKHEETVNKFRRGLMEFKTQQGHSTDPAVNKTNDEIFRKEVDRVNDVIREYDETEIEVSNLLLIPANSLNLKECPIDPNLISAIMDLIEGEPTFDEDKAPAK